MQSPVTKSGDRLVEYFAIVGAPCDRPLELASAESAHRVEGGKLHALKNAFAPVLLERFPLLDHETPFPGGVPAFAFPASLLLLRRTASDEPLPTTFRWTGTDTAGRQVYGYTLVFHQPCTGAQVVELDREGSPDTRLYQPRAFVLLTRFPFEQFRSWLTELYRTVLSGSAIPLERIVCNFCTEVPLPPAGRLEVSCAIGHTTLLLKRPPPNRRLSTAGLPFRDVFEALDHDNIIAAWLAVATDRQVLLVSSQLSLLAATADVLVALLFPLRYTHTCIPICPEGLAEVLQAPMPYLAGVSTSLYAAVAGDLSEGVLVVDIDRNAVWSTGPPTDSGRTNRRPAAVPTLPPRVRAKLLRALRAHGDAFSWRGPDFIFSRLPHMDSAFSFAARPDEVEEGVGEDGEEDVELTDDEEEGDGAAAAPTTSWYRRRMGGGSSSSSRAPDRRGRGVRGEDGVRPLSWSKVRAAFFRVFTSLFLRYREFMNFTPGVASHATGVGAITGRARADTAPHARGEAESDIRFDREGFVASAAADSRPLLTALLETQLFNNFLDDRLKPFGGDVAAVIDLAFFDEQLDAKLNRSRLAGVLGGKRLTPFLSSTEWAIAKTIVALGPDTAGLPGYPYRRYEPFPVADTMDGALFTPPRAHESFHDDWEVSHSAASHAAPPGLTAAAPPPAAGMLDWFIGASSRPASQGAASLAFSLTSLSSVSREALMYSAWFIVLAAGLDRGARAFAAETGAAVEEAIRARRAEDARGPASSPAGQPLSPVSEEEAEGTVVERSSTSGEVEAEGEAEDARRPLSRAWHDAPLEPGEERRRAAAVTAAHAAFTARALDQGFAVLTRMRADLTSRATAARNSGGGGSNTRQLSALMGRAAGPSAAILTAMSLSGSVAPSELELAYRSLLDACSRAGAFAKAYSLLQEMQAGGLAADASLYRALFAAFFNSRPGGQAVSGGAPHTHVLSARLDLSPLAPYGTFLRRSGTFIDCAEAEVRRAAVRRVRADARRVAAAAAAAATAAAAPEDSPSATPHHSSSLSSFLSGGAPGGTSISSLSLSLSLGTRRNANRDTGKAGRHGSVASGGGGASDGEGGHEPFAWTADADSTTGIKHALSTYGPAPAILAAGRRGVRRKARAAASAGGVSESEASESEASVVEAAEPPPAPVAPRVEPILAGRPPRAASLGPPPVPAPAPAPAPSGGGGMLAAFGYRSASASRAGVAARPGSVASVGAAAAAPAPARARSGAPRSGLPALPRMSLPSLSFPSLLSLGTDELVMSSRDAWGAPSEWGSVAVESRSEEEEGGQGALSGIVGVDERHITVDTEACVAGPAEEVSPLASSDGEVEGLPQEQGEEVRDQELEEEAFKAHDGPHAVGLAQPGAYAVLPPGLTAGTSAWVAAMAYSHPVDVPFGSPRLRALFPRLAIDCDRETCPYCGHRMSAEDVRAGWTGDAQDNTTVCAVCAAPPPPGSPARVAKRFVARFSVSCDAKGWVGSGGGSPGPGNVLLVEHVHPAVLIKELQAVLGHGKFGPGLRGAAPAVFWGLIAAFGSMPGGPLPADILDRLAGLEAPAAPEVPRSPALAGPTPARVPISSLQTRFSVVSTAVRAVPALGREAADRALAIASTRAVALDAATA